MRGASDVGGALRVDGYRPTGIGSFRTVKSGVDECASQGIDLGDEGVLIAAVNGLGGSVSSGKIERSGVAGDVSVTRGIGGDRGTGIVRASAKIGRIEDRAKAVVLGDRTIVAAGNQSLESSGGDRERPVAEPCDIGVAKRVDRDA